MVELYKKSKEDGEELTGTQIVLSVLTKTSGYLRGLGFGSKASTSKSTTLPDYEIKLQAERLAREELEARLELERQYRQDLEEKVNALIEAQSQIQSQLGISCGKQRKDHDQSDDSTGSE